MRKSPRTAEVTVTDPLRIKRTDPGRPEICNVCQLHRFFGDDYETIWEGERTARVLIGAVLLLAGMATEG